MNRKALGLIETYGYIGAIEAADACLKAANVELLGLELVRGGLVTIKICGDVSAVKASVDAGAVAADRVGKVVSIDVIARMGEGLEKIVFRQDKAEEANIGLEGKAKENIRVEISNELQVNAIATAQEFVEIDDVEECIDDSTTEEDFDTVNDIVTDDPSTEGIINYKGKAIKISDERVLNNLKVVDLRRIARRVDGISIEKSMIKFAKKRELIEALTSCFNREV